MAAIAQVSAVADAGQTAALLEDKRVLEIVQRIARSVAQPAANRLPGRGRPRRQCGPTRTEYVSIDGFGYYLHAKRLATVSGQSTILVAVERCPRQYPLPHELKATFGLTPREARVAILLATGKSNREIAGELGVTEHTARRHTEKVLLKLSVHRRKDVQGALLRCRRSSNRRRRTDCIKMSA